MYTNLLHGLFALFKAVMLKLDPYAFIPLEEFSGKRVLISILNLGDFGIEFKLADIKLIEITEKSKTSYAYDCCIQGSLSSFLDLLFKYKQLIPGKGITLSGDLPMAQRFFECFLHMDPDWTQLLAARIPKTIMILLNQFSSQTIPEIKAWQTTRQRDLQAFLVDEIRVLPSRSAMLNLESQAARLSAQSAHLETKLVALKQTVDSSKV